MSQLHTTSGLWARSSGRVLGGCILVRASLPGAVGIAEVDGQSGVDAQLGVLGHLGSLVPGQRTSQLFGQGDDGGGDGVTDGLGAVRLMADRS